MYFSFDRYKFVCILKWNSCSTNYPSDILALKWLQITIFPLCSSCKMGCINLMNNVFKPFIRNFVIFFYYFNDILVYKKSQIEHWY